MSNSKWLSKGISQTKMSLMSFEKINRHYLKLANSIMYSDRDDIIDFNLDYNVGVKKAWQGITRLLKLFNLLF